VPNEETLASDAAGIAGGRSRVAVVICNWNGGRFLPRALEALAAQGRPADRIIVVDNGSTDGSVAIVRRDYPNVELVELGRNAGFAAANNAGARAARDCDWLVLLNPDAFPEPQWLDELIGAGEARAGVAMVASRMVRAGAPDELDGTGDVYHVSGMAWRRDHGRRAASSEVADTPGEVFSTCGGAAAYRREAFMAAGGFDEDYSSFFEDTDLAFRLRLAGQRCWYAPKAVVHHVGSGTAGEKSDYSVYHGHRNLVWTYAKNMPWPLVLLYLPQHLLLNAVSFGWFTLRGQGRTLWRAKVDAVRGLPRALGKRRRIQASASVTPWKVRAAMNRGLDFYPLWSAIGPEVSRLRERLGRRVLTMRDPSALSTVLVRNAISFIRQRTARAARAARAVKGVRLTCRS
jgi:GT2 family glycosyltransferase